MPAAADDLEAARADRNLVAMRDAAIRGRQRRNARQIILAAPEQFVGQALVHAVAAEEPALRLLAFFGAAVLVIDRLQIFDLRHVERAIKTLDDPAGEASMIGMGVGDDQPADLDACEWPSEQSGPCGNRFL